jgi:hypothetical protein
METLIVWELFEGKKKFASFVKSLNIKRFYETTWE